MGLIGILSAVLLAQEYNFAGTWKGVKANLLPHRPGVLRAVLVAGQVEGQVEDLEEQVVAAEFRRLRCE
jgi:hypothetical protein